MPKIKITIRSQKHSFTPYPSLSPYRWTEWLRPNKLAACGLEELFFQLCCCVSFLFWWEIGFGFTYLCTLLNKSFYELIFWRVPTFVDQITTGKKRYSRLAVGWNKSPITVCHVKIQTPPITFNLRKFLFGFFILQEQWDPNFLLLCISFLLCMDL